MDRPAPEPPQFPAGAYEVPSDYEDGRLRARIAEIEHAPVRLRAAVAGLAGDQLGAMYRNWSIRQIVHHVADSHLNGYIRFRLALTEERPTIKPYDESSWARLEDALTADVEPSLRLLEGVHARWVHLARSLPQDAWLRAFYHPESRETVPLWRHLDQYAWHGRHHTQQIVWVREHRLTP
jgi:hypothetical protein